jgi:dTDP-4-amino-4,6-dideoxygalactose transaminase
VPVPVRNPAPYSAARDFDLGDPDSPPARPSAWLAPRLAGPEVAAQRRSNYSTLAAALGERVSPAFVQLPHGASPFAFPVEVDDKQAYLDRLRARGIIALSFWSRPHPSLPEEQFPIEAALRERVVGLPVHQELRGEDLDCIAEAAVACLSR